MENSNTQKAVSDWLRSDKPKHDCRKGGVFSSFYQNWICLFRNLIALLVCAKTEGVKCEQTLRGVVPDQTENKNNRSVRAQCKVRGTSTQVRLKVAEELGSLSERRSKSPPLTD